LGVRIPRGAHNAPRSAPGASLSRLSNVVNRLERRGYLRRQADPTDGRCSQAILTDAGMAKVGETAPGHVAAARQFIIDAVTPAQLRQLRAANDRILSRVDPEATTKPPRSTPVSRHPRLRVAARAGRTSTTHGPSDRGGTSKGAAMATYVQLGAVKTWYDEHGQGEPLVLLDGGLVDARFFEPNLAPLAERSTSTPSSGQPADLVGHSDGAFVAMLVAMQRPELVKRLVMISGGFNKGGDAEPDAEWNVDQIAEFLGPA
jgi:hypothetical protein